MAARMWSVYLYLAAVAGLCRKEILTLLQDRASRAILVGPVLMQALLYGYGATYDLNHAPYAVLDQSRGAASGELLARLDAGGVFERRATLRSSHEIEAVVSEGRVLLVLHFPPDFESRLAAGHSAPLQLILDGRHSISANAASAHVGAVVAAYNQQQRGTAPIALERRAWFNPNLESRWNIMPALIAALSLIQTLLLAALSVAREREQGTFDQLLVSPLTPAQILLGKALPAMLVGLLQSTLILLIIRYWFQIPMGGSPWLLYAGLAVFATAVAGLGLCLSALALNLQQAMLYTFLVLMPMMLLSGLLSPVRNMPEWLQWATYANPLRFGIDLVRRVYLEGAGWPEVAFNFLPMLATGVVTLTLSAWLFRHRLS